MQVWRRNKTVEEEVEEEEDEDEKGKSGVGKTKGENVGRLSTEE